MSKDDNDKFRYLSVNQLSKLTGRDRATITKRLELVQPAKETGRARYYDCHEVLSIIFAVENVKGIQKKMEQVAYEAEKEKLKKLRIANEKTMGKLVDISEVTSTVEKEYTFIRAQFRSLPSRVTKLVSNESDPVIINKILTDEVDAVLSELISDTVYENQMKEIEAMIDAKRNETVEVQPSEGSENSPSSDSETESSGMGGQ